MQKVWIFIVPIIGSIIGSFLCAVIDRFSNLQAHGDRDADIRLLCIPSACPHCQKRLSYIDMIPILSYLFLRGHCRYCQQSISPKSFIFECLTTIVTTVIIYQYGFSVHIVCYLFFLMMIVVLAYIDWSARYLPDTLVYLLLWIGLCVSAQFAGYEASIWGAITAWSILELLRLAFKLRGQDAIGLGDLKYASALSAWLGIKSLPYFLLFASIIGLCMYFIGQKFPQSKFLDGNKSIAFGVALSMSAACLFCVQVL